jgi:hypothetical protein
MEMRFGLPMKWYDSVKQLIDVLGDFSTKLAVPQLSMALDIAKPLAQGVSAPVGMTNGEMMLGIDTPLTGADPQGGSFAIVYATTGRNYMVIRIERADTREDFDSLSAIREPYQRAVDMLSEGQLESAQSLLKKAIGAALKSNDLTESDHRRVIEALKKRYNDAKELIGSNFGRR